jgi:hypothetical protein
MGANCTQRLVKATAMSKGFHYWWREGSGSLFMIINRTHIYILS